MKIDKIYWLPDHKAYREILPEEIELYLSQLYKFTLVDREGELVLFMARKLESLAYHAMLLAKGAELLGWVTPEEARRYVSYCMKEEPPLEIARNWQQANLEALGGGIYYKGTIGPDVYEWESSLYGKLQGRYLELVKALFPISTP